MTTQYAPIHIDGPDSIASFSRISDQITSAAAPSVGNYWAYVLADGATDNGVFCTLWVPENLSTVTGIEVVGILDGAPGASDVLGLGVQGKATDDNESADGAFSTEDVVSATIGSSGTAHSDEDEYREVITLSNLTMTAGEMLRFKLFLDVSATTYAGNFLLPATGSIRLVYDDGL